MPDPSLSSWIDAIDKKFGFSSGPGASGGSSGGGSSGGGSQGVASTTAGGASAPGKGAASAIASNPGAAPTAVPAPGAPSTGGPGSGVGMPTPSIPKSVGGSGAKAQADAAEAGASAAEAAAGKAKTAETELQTLVQEAGQHKTEATGAKTAAEQALQGIAAAPPVPAPQGAEPKAKYDSAIQISGSLRTAQQGADAKAGDARSQEGVAQTAVKSLAAKVTAAGKKAADAKGQADQASQHAKAATEAAHQAVQEAAKSKTAADQAAGDDPGKAALQKTAQEDTGHVARAKTAAGKAVSAAKQASSSSTSAQSQAKALESAQQEAQQAADAVGQSVAGLDAKLKPFGDAVGQAEAQEAECKSNLSAEDAQAVLEKRYEELGGDAELQKALSAEDKAFQTVVETFRANIKDWQKDRIRELDEHRTELEKTSAHGEAIMPGIEAWHGRESAACESMRARASALGEKSATEPAKEVAADIDGHAARVDKAASVIAYNKKVLEQTKAMQETLAKRYKDVDGIYEAAEEFANTLGTELDNELQMSSMTLEQKVDFLQTKPQPVRDRIQKQMDGELQRILQGTLADTLAENPRFEPEQSAFEPEPIDWGPVTARLAELEATPLEVLQGEDPELVPIQKEYEAAGGDKALFEKRVAAWKEAVLLRDKQDKQASDVYRKQSDTLQQQVDETVQTTENSEANIAETRAAIARNEARIRELVAQLDPVTLQGLSPQEVAEHRRLKREVEQWKKEVEARQRLLASQRTAQTNAETLRDQHKKKYESTADDDAYPPPVKPESKDITALPLRAKYTELTGKAAPA